MKGFLRFPLTSKSNTSWWAAGPSELETEWDPFLLGTILLKNYTGIDPKQFTVSKFRLKPVILISECFCSRCGHTNQHPPPTWRETTGDNGRQRETRPLQSPRSRPHQPTPTPHMEGDNRRQPETTGDKTTSEPKMAATPTNTHPPHEGRQPETTGDKTTSEPKKPTTPTNTRPPHEGRQPETTGDKTTSEPKKPTTPTNTQPPNEGRQPGDNGRQDHFRAQEADHTNQHPPPTWRETTGDKTTSEPKKPTTPTNTKAARSKVALRIKNPNSKLFGEKVA